MALSLGSCSPIHTEKKIVVQIDSKTWIWRLSPDLPEFLGGIDLHEIDAGSLTQFSKIHGHWNQYLTINSFNVAYFCTCIHIQTLFLSISATNSFTKNKNNCICTVVQHSRTSPIQGPASVAWANYRNGLPRVNITKTNSNFKYFFSHFVKTRCIFSNVIIILNAKKIVLNIILVTEEK